MFNARTFRIAMNDDQALLEQLKPRPASADYFDLDDILATQEKVPSQFELLGFLDTGTADEHIAEGSKMELPYWLASKLCSISVEGKRWHVVSVELPKIYNEAHRQIVKADANVLNLHAMGPHFYKFGSKLLHFEHPDAGLVAQSLLNVFLKRFRRIMDASQNAFRMDNVKLQAKLDAIELAMFLEGQRSLNSFEAWLRGTAGKLSVSSTIAAISHQRKRKRADDVEP